jgi:hypothetical protein
MAAPIERPAPAWLLGFRARAMAFGLVAFGLALRAPAGLRGGAAFALSPPGLAIAGLGLVALGDTLDESGTVARIRVGAAVRVAAAIVTGLAAPLWSLAIPAPTAGLGAAGIVMAAAGALAIGLVARHDAAVRADPRHGQDVRLEGLRRGALELSVRGASVVVPTSAIRAATVVARGGGRATVIVVSNRDGIRGDAASLPWAAALAEGDALVLTEHQSGLDAAALAARVLEASGAAREEYR